MKKIKYVLSLVAVFSFLGCKKIDVDVISPEYKKILDTKPILELGEASLKNAPTEKIAVELVDYFEKKYGKTSTDQFKQCAAMVRLKELGKKSKCNNLLEGDEDQACAVKAGYWKGNLHKNLLAIAIDINADKIPDYIVSGDYCTGLSHNYTQEYFVFLSQKNGSYRVALSTNANSFAVLPNIKNGAKLIVEGISSYNGISQKIWSFENFEYKNEACFYKPNVDHEIEFKNVACYIPPAPVKEK